MPLFSCAGTRPSNLGVKESRLAPCPSSPNCVSSDDSDDAHAIAPFHQPKRQERLGTPYMRRLPVCPGPRSSLQVTIIYMPNAVAPSSGFVDDIELHLRPAQNVIAARSAARLGHSDFGVNRKRVENLRSLLQQQQGVVR